MRVVVRELSNMQNCQSPVSMSQPVTTINARDASASENRHCRNFPAWGKTCCLNCATPRLAYSGVCARLRFLLGVGFYGYQLVKCGVHSTLDGSLVSTDKHNANCLVAHAIY